MEGESGRDEAAVLWWRMGSPMGSAPVLANLEMHDRMLPGGGKQRTKKIVRRMTLLCSQCY